MDEERIKRNIELAYLGLCSRGEKATQASMARETLTVSRITAEGSLPDLVQRCARILGTIESVAFEESSQRFVVTFRADNGGGEAETARSERADGSRGALVRGLWPSLAGHRAVLYKHNERAGESKEASNGYRVVVWAQDLGAAVPRQ